VPEIKVLLVDDIELVLELEKDFLESEESILGRAGFHLLTARNGQEAIDLAKKHRPNIVFMDLYMPQMDGDEACRWIKTQPELSGTAVIMVTEGVRPGDLERCHQSGCDDILLKPINRESFIAIFHTWLQDSIRIAPRVEARLNLRYGEEQNLLSNYSVNLSTGGVFIETANILSPDTALCVEFMLPESREKIACKGRVAWVNHPDKILNPALPAGMGIQFLDLHECNLAAIREYIKTQGFQSS
jgi:uncharacterized protein (TIGR02266 family)